MPAPKDYVTDQMREDVAGGNFEAIWATLFAWLGDLADFKTSGRVVRDIQELSAPEQNPCLFLAQGNEDSPTLLGTQAQAWVLHGEVIIYAHRGGNPDTVPGSVLNPILGALRGALIPSNTDVYTLAGLAGRCRIAGTVEVYEGVLGEMAMAVVPIEVTILLT